MADDKTYVTVTESDIRELDRLITRGVLLKSITVVCLIFGGITLPMQIAFIVAMRPRLPTANLVLATLGLVALIGGVVAMFRWRNVGKKVKALFERVRQTARRQ